MTAAHMAGESLSLEVMMRAKRRVALISVGAAVGITALKLAVGLSTASLGILSEAAHSGLDLVAAIITFLSVRVSDKPADADHQYGHGKFENFSAFVEMTLLAVTTIWIVGEACFRLMHLGERTVDASWAAFAVMGFCITVDFMRARALGQVAARYKSQALQADALNFSSDIWSSAAVIAGLGLVRMGQAFGIRWLAGADSVAALFVAGVILYVSSRLARQTIDALLDAAPAGVRGQIMQAVSSVEGVLMVERARIRRAGNRYFADVAVGLARNLTFQKSEQIAEAVTRAVQGVLPEADVVVHPVARAAHSESIFDQIRAVAARNNLNVHDVSVQKLHERLHVEQHLELDEHLSLKEAHEHVTRLETEMRAAVPQISSILTHIESEPATIESGQELDPAQSMARKLEPQLRRVALLMPEIMDVHDFSLKRVGPHLNLSCHVTLADEMPLSRVHEVCTELEARFKRDAPQLFRVLIHPEPSTDNRR